MEPRSFASASDASCAGTAKAPGEATPAARRSLADQYWKALAASKASESDPRSARMRTALWRGLSSSETSNSENWRPRSVPVSGSASRPTPIMCVALTGCRYDEKPGILSSPSTFGTASSREMTNNGSVCTKVTK